MKLHSLHRTVSLVLVLALVGLASSCSKQAKRDRAIARANRYLAADELDKAEIEYRNALRLDPRHAAALRQLGLIYQQQGKPLFAFPVLEQAVKADPENATLRAKFALASLVVGKVKEARVEALRVLEGQPTNGEALLVLADTSLGAKELEEAGKLLEKLRAQAAQTAEYHVAWSTFYLRQKDRTNATGAVQQALRVDPQSPTVHAALANLALLDQDLKQAEAELKTAADLAPLRSALRLRYIDFKLRTGAEDEARKLLEQLTERAPDYVPAWTRRMHLAYADRKYDDCASLADRVVVRDPPNFEALMTKARLRLVKGELAKALNESERLAALYRGSPVAQYQLGLTQLLNADLTKALASLNQAVSLDPHYAEAVILLAELNTRKGDAAAAITALSRFLKEHPEVAQAHGALAEAYRAQGKVDEALAVYRRLGEMLPKNPRPAYETGVMLLGQRKFAGARKALEQARALAPDWLPPLEQLVEVDLAEKRPAAALQRVEQDLARNPKSASLQFLVARLHIARNDTAQAETALKKTIELDPNLQPAYFVYARLLLATRKPEEALEQLRTLLTRNPKDTGALALVGMIQGNLKHHDAARDAYEKILTLNTNHIVALNNLAYLYSEHYMQLDKAFQQARRARELAPQDPYAADTLGWINYRRGEYPWALTLIKESADKLPNEPEVQYHLGMTHYMMGEEAPARVALEKAAGSQREFVGKDEVARRLAILQTQPDTADPNVLARLEKAVEENPKDPVALARLGAAYEQKGAFDQAIKLYERALAVNPKAVPFLVRLATLYAERTGDAKKAVELARTARELASGDPEVARTLGRLAYRAGDHAWALSLLQESARQQTPSADLLFDLAEASYAMGRVADTRDTMQQALKTAPGFGRADEASRFIEMAQLASDPARAVAVSDQIQSALQQRPDWLPALYASAVVLESRGEVSNALKAYNGILARFPRFAPASRSLAILQVQEPVDAKRALEAAQKARDLFPNDAEVAKALGVQFYRNGDHANAVRLLKESARNRASDAELYYYLGLAHGQLKQTKESREALNKALSLSPDARFIPDAKRALAALGGQG